MRRIFACLLCYGALSLAFPAAAQQSPAAPEIDPDVVAPPGLVARGFTPCSVTIDVGDGSGEIPSSGNQVPVTVSSNLALSSIELQVADVPDVLFAAACVPGAPDVGCSVSDSGTATFAISGAIPPAFVFDISYDLAAGAPEGEVALLLSGSTATTTVGDPCEVTEIDGTFVVGSVPVCGDGEAEAGEECDDGNTEPGDCCAPDCSHDSPGAPCEDGVFCTAGDTCGPAGVCEAGPPRSCEDAIACTTDACDEAANECDHEPVDSVCDDGFFCNGVEPCSPTAGCLDGVAVYCDDSDPCTDDVCVEEDAACTYEFDSTNAPACANCGNGIVDPEETCDDGNQEPGDCCSASCQADPVFTVCGETADFCVLLGCNHIGDCSVVVPRDCGDGVGCTEDTCNEAANACTHFPGDTRCDNGAYCDGAESCDAAADCLPGTPVACDDGDVCTDDACNEAANSCSYLFDSTNAPRCASCGNGVVELGESCDDGNHLPGDCCSPSCVATVPGGPCNDGLFCTVGETCDESGSCGRGVPGCDDGIACTIDQCIETNDTCRIFTDFSLCNDGVFCNGSESCHPTLGCRAGLPPCSPEECNEETDTCPGGGPSGVPSLGTWSALVMCLLLLSAGIHLFAGRHT